MPSEAEGWGENESLWGNLILPEIQQKHPLYPCCSPPCPDPILHCPLWWKIQAVPCWEDQRSSPQLPPLVHQRGRKGFAVWKCWISALCVLLCTWPCCCLQWLGANDSQSIRGENQMAACRYLEGALNEVCGACLSGPVLPNAQCGGTSPKHNVLLWCRLKPDPTLIASHLEPHWGHQKVSLMSWSSCKPSSRP